MLFAPESLSEGLLWGDTDCGRTMPPTCVHALVSRTCDHVAHYGHRDAVGVAKAWRREVTLHCVGEPAAITRVLVRGRRVGQGQREEG